MKSSFIPPIKWQLRVTGSASWKSLRDYSTWHCVGALHIITLLAIHIIDLNTTEPNFYLSFINTSQFIWDNWWLPNLQSRQGHSYFRSWDYQMNWKICRTMCFPEKKLIVPVAKASISIVLPPPEIYHN